MRTSISLFLLALLFLPGCATVRPELDEARVAAEIREGRSKEEIRKLFGTPGESTTRPSGHVLDVYWSVIPRMKPGGTYGFTTFDVRTAHILYGPRGNVLRHTYFAGEARGFTSSRVAQLGTDLKEEDLDRIKPNKTTYDEMIQIFGSPPVEGINVYGLKTASWIFANAYADQKADATGHSRELYVVFNPEMQVVHYKLFKYSRF